jgi:hypothetical protein
MMEEQQGGHRLVGNSGSQRRQEVLPYSPREYGPAYACIWDL